MKIGVLGSGIVGQVLATGFLKHGYEVMVGTRSPEKLKEWAAKNPSGHTGTFDATAKFADLIVLAVNGKVAADALRSAGNEKITGKIVIDATNPIADAPPVNGVLRFFTDINNS